MSAEAFFARARAMAAEGHLEYAIDLFVDGLKLDPDNTPARKDLREAGLRLKAGGGKALSMLKQVKLRKSTGNAVLDLLNTEKLLAYDAGNTHWMVAAAQRANEAKLPEATAFYLRLVEQARKATG
jgi:hypothetical protein